ncbi:MAG: two-component system response regulator NarL, partial [Gammaproteobacteria bacterium]|nr:two-component system response regulator NarL [Gammaproteobacteria bacterium]
MRVLIIDDHTLFRDGLQGLLERHNIEVVASLG